MRQLISIVGLVFLVLLAGCGGGFGFDTGTETSSTVTPAPVPTDDPLSSPPTGLSEDGITDSSALADAHAEALANTSFTIKRNHTLITPNGTRLVDTTSVRRIGANHSHWTIERAFNGTNARSFERIVEHLGIWFNGTHGFYQFQGPNETAYRVLLGIGGVEDPTSRPLLLSYYVQAESTTVSTENGRIQLRANLEPENKRSPFMPTVNVTEQTVVLTLTETGRVERYRVEYIGRLVNGSDMVVEGVRVGRFTRLGETQLERSDWIPTARNATNAREQTG